MAELFFIATTIFVAYVVFDVVGKKEKPKANIAPPISPTSADTSTPAPVVEPIAKTSKARSTSSKITSPTATPTDNLKNPKTGEIAKLPANYAFAKRWIKDALVEEGLLEKVYKNNELNAEVTTKIQAALQQLKAMPKYQ